MANSISRNSAAKSPSRTKTTPATTPRRKPRFPLWQHAATGQWAKKIKGRTFYFGTDKDTALDEYVRVKEYREAGLEPPPKDEERVTLKSMGDTFLTHKKHQVELGELTERSFKDYWTTCQGLADFFGKGRAVETIQPSDLLKYRRKLGETLGPTSLGNEVNRCRVVLRFAFENGLIDRPVRFGEFKRPKKAAVRRHREKQGLRMFSAAELRKLYYGSTGQLRAMILLGINCGFGNADCGRLPIKAVDLAGGWVDFPRPKTGVARRAPLWAETTEAIQSVLDTRKRPVDEDNANLLFVTKYGGSWHADAARSAVGAEFRKLLNKLKLYRPGLSFYALRHTFQTIGDESGDYLAVRRIMGHADNSISDHYRERFDDRQLKRVVEYVHRWLFPRPTVEREEAAQ